MSTVDSTGGGRKVLVTLHDGAPGGAVLAFLRLVPILEERGWRFAFWAPAPSPVSERLRDAGHVVGGGVRGLDGYSLEALRHPPGTRARLRAAGRYLAGFARFARAERPALVHANSLYTLAEATTARAAGIPAVLHIHEMMPANWKTPAALAAVRALGIRVVAVSAGNAERLAVRGRTPMIVYESAPVPEAEPSRTAGPGPLVVGSVGVISRRKGTDVFVEAAGQVLARRDDVRFELVGSYPDSPEAPWAERVVGRARELGIEYRPQADVYERLRGWDLFVLASRSDPFPLVVLEAMASGLPVVAANGYGGVAEQVDAASGLLVPPEDSAALAEAIHDVLDRPASERAAMGRAGRERVARNFTPRHSALDLERAYLTLLGRG